MNRREFLVYSLLVPAVALVPTSVRATTWADKEFTCPVCATKNSFRVVMSYGSYIFSWPSKYQLIYWPVTDGNSVYCCKSCHLSMFMWDYEELAKDKVPLIKKQLDGLNVKLIFKDYAEVPMSQRLEIAESVYRDLEMKDNFWCYFYRILGYHYAGESKTAKAEESRKKALNLSQKMLGDKNPAIAAKELLIISGAMKHFLKDDPGSVADLNKALSTRYQDKDLDAEKNNNAEQNLNALVKDYLEQIKSPKPPRDNKQ
jgi:uncharacterized protein (DUF2225 family)